MSEGTAHFRRPWARLLPKVGPSGGGRDQSGSTTHVSARVLTHRRTQLRIATVCMHTLQSHSLTILSIPQVASRPGASGEKAKEEHVLLCARTDHSGALGELCVYVYVYVFVIVGAWHGPPRCQLYCTAVVATTQTEAHAAHDMRANVKTAHAHQQSSHVQIDLPTPTPTPTPRTERPRHGGCRRRWSRGGARARAGPSPRTRGPSGGKQGRSDTRIDVRSALFIINNGA